MGKQFDFDGNFVSVDRQEEGYEFEVKNDAGKPSGFFITVAGPDSQRRHSTQARIQEAMQGNIVSTIAGKPNETSATFRDMELDDLVAATISWRYPEGFDGPPCTPDNARSLYTRHSTIRAQVSKAAGDLSRFTQR